MGPVRRTLLNALAAISCPTRPRECHQGYTLKSDPTSGGQRTKIARVIPGVLKVVQPVPVMSFTRTTRAKSAT